MTPSKNSDTDINHIAHESKQPPALYVIPTPIGNLGDITLRALEILKSVDYVYCEDTRVSKKLLNHFNITTNLRPYHDFSTQKDRNRLIQHIQSGKSVALISDAGTPLVSDPGYKLIQDIHQANIHLECLPGATSVTTALILSGLPSNRFLFEGFLPPKELAKRKRLDALKFLDSTLIFFEANQRLTKTMNVLKEQLGNRDVAVIREMTKHYQEVKRGTLNELANYYQEHTVKGEIVIVVGPPVQQEYSSDDVNRLLKDALKTSSTKEAASQIHEITAIAKKELYQLALTIKNETK